MTGSAPAAAGEPLAIICGGGSLPFAVADAAIRSGRRVVLFPLRGAADPARVQKYPHHWIRFGSPARFRRLARADRCHDVVLIGSVVRPRVGQIWPDLLALRLLPRIIALLRGGDDRLLSGIGKLFEEHGFRLVGADEIAPEILMPIGPLGRFAPSERDWSDIATGLSLMRATGPFDVGQAVVVSDNRILAIEAADGTDAMLAHVADLRKSGTIRTPIGSGVLVKAPKPGQNRRVDLPSIGPRTVEGAARAGLAGIAVIAGSSIVAEPERIPAVADAAGLFVVGIESQGFD
jgi:DUF1009 family protein